MALRLIEMMINKKDGSEVPEFLGKQKIIEILEVPLVDEVVLIRILLDTEESEEARIKSHVYLHFCFDYIVGCIN